MLSIIQLHTPVHDIIKRRKMPLNKEAYVCTYKLNKFTIKKFKNDKLAKKKSNSSK